MTHIFQPPNFPPRPLGQINPIKLSWPGHLLGSPISRTPLGIGGIQVDGQQPVIALLETYESPFGAFVQLDGLQAVSSLLETYASPFGNFVQVDGLQAVAVLMET